jgi:hypothetical protein
MQHDIVGLLGENHARLAELSQALRACARPRAALAQFDEFAVMLGAHLTLAKRVIYPALKGVGWRNVSSTLLLGHARLTQAFAELLTLKRANGAFADALADLLEATERVVERERSELLPILAQHFSAGERLALAAEAREYLPDTPRRASRPEAEQERQNARDWIEEARLLLGGLRSSVSPQEPAP